MPSAYSNIVTVAVIAPPDAPVLSGELDGMTAELSWTEDTGGITGYNLYRSEADNPLALYLNLGTDTSYDDTGLEGGTTYNYAVTALIGAIEGAQSNTVSLTPSASPSLVTFNITVGQD